MSRDRSPNGIRKLTLQIPLPPEQMARFERLVASESKRTGYPISNADLARKLLAIGLDKLEG